MNENLENQIAIILKKSLEIAEKTGNFVLDQAPELLKEFYTWHIVFSCLMICVAIIVFMLLRYVSNLFGEKESFEYTKDKGYSWEKITQSEKIRNRYYSDKDWYRGRLSFTILSYVVFLAIAIPNVVRLLKIIVAPKVYLIEYFLN